MNPTTMHRWANAALRHRIPLVPRLLEGVIFLLCHCVVPASAEIGNNTKLAYRGLGTVIHTRARIGDNVMIGPGVVIGGKSGAHEVPVVESGCFIGAGAKILGPITVGAGSVVGANAVVVDDVAPRSLVAGVPARVLASDVNVDDYGELPVPLESRSGV